MTSRIFRRSLSDLAPAGRDLRLADAPWSLKLLSTACF